MPTALLVENLTMRYRDTLAVDRLGLSVTAGTITAVLGPNGAGKTTTLETAVGFRRPQQGTVRTLGLDPIAQRRALLPRIGVMPQAGGAWSGVRAAEMLRHVASMYAHPHDVGMLIERLGLAGCGRTTYRHLSGGQQRRLGLAMAIVGRPELLFVDEPTAGLDPQARHATWALLTELRRDGVTVVLTTHLIDEAERLADQVYVIDHGSVVASGTPAELTAADPPAGGRSPTRPAPPAAADALTLRTSGRLPARTLAADLAAAGCRGIDVQPADGGELRVTGAITPAVITAVASCCQARDAAIERLDHHHHQPDAGGAREVPDLAPSDQPTDARAARSAPVGREPGRGGRTLEDVFLDLTGRQIR